MSLCPCGTGQEYEACCGQYHAGRANAPTAEALMRSRYSAFVKGEIDYLRRTLLPHKQAKFDDAGSRSLSDNAQWKGLTIHSMNKGGPDDDTGEVEFEAAYEMNGTVQAYVELGKFSKRDGQWYYVDGVIRRRGAEPQRRETPKVGRNEPCPCGSGKKFKKCCG